MASGVTTLWYVNNVHLVQHIKSEYQTIDFRIFIFHIYQRVVPVNLLL